MFFFFLNERERTHPSFLFPFIWGLIFHSLITEMYANQAAFHRRAIFVKGSKGGILKSLMSRIFVKGTLIEMSSGYYLRCSLPFFIVLFSANL